MLTPKNMLCISCPYWHRAFGCHAVNKVCELPSLKNPPRLVLTAVDISKLLDDCCKLTPVENADSLNLQPLVNEFGE
jgi:hypothetical protein